MSVDASNFVVLGQVLLAAGAVGAVVVPVVKLWNKKADKHTVASQLQEMKSEQTVHRGYFKDVFEKLEAHQRRDEDLAREIMSTMSSNHAEVLRELGRKADR